MIHKSFPFLLALALLPPVPAAAEGAPIAPLLVEVNPQGEWVEFVNPTPRDLVLDGWSLADHDSCLLAGAGRIEDPHFPLDGVVVPARGRVLVSLWDGDACVRLHDSADDLDLLAPDGSLVQRVTWGPGGDVPSPPLAKSVAACSLADLAHGAWGIATATPRAGNGACVGS